MAVAQIAAFQHNGPFQFAQQQGFQTQILNIWNPIATPSHPIAIWQPIINKPGGPWTPVPVTPGLWRPI